LFHGWLSIELIPLSSLRAITSECSYRYTHLQLTECFISIMMKELKNKNNTPILHA
jgi:hypothetical protein